MSKEGELTCTTGIKVPSEFDHVALIEVEIDHAAGKTPVNKQIEVAHPNR
jgi:hypothetical protein